METTFAILPIEIIKEIVMTIDVRSRRMLIITCNFFKFISVNIHLCDITFGDIFLIPELTREFLQMHLDQISYRADSRYLHTQCANLILAAIVSGHNRFVLDIITVVINKTHPTLDTDYRKKIQAWFSDLVSAVRYISYRIKYVSVIINEIINIKDYQKIWFYTILDADRYDILKRLFNHNSDEKSILLCYLAASHHLVAKYCHLERMAYDGKYDTLKYCVQNNVDYHDMFCVRIPFLTIKCAAYGGHMDLFIWLTDICKCAITSDMVGCLLRCNYVDVYRNLYSTGRCIRYQWISPFDVFTESHTAWVKNLPRVSLATFEYCLNEFGWSMQFSFGQHIGKIDTEVCIKYKEIIGN
jgi:hypothetical protein